MKRTEAAKGEGKGKRGMVEWEEREGGMTEWEEGEEGAHQIRRRESTRFDDELLFLSR